MGEIEGAGLAAAVCDLVSVLFSGLSIEANLALDPSLALEKVANFTRMVRAFDESNSAAQAHYRGDDASRMARSQKKRQGGPLPKHRRHLECQQAIFPQRGRRHWARGRPKTGRASMMHPRSCCVTMLGRRLRSPTSCDGASLLNSNQAGPERSGSAISLAHR